MLSLVDKISAIETSLSSAAIPHAFGGALALAYATAEPRGTRDIDVNVFVAPADARSAFLAMPTAVAWSDDDLVAVATDEQVRLWWGDTPVDVFFAAHPFHFAAGDRARRVPFDGRTIPVLAPADLAIFKTLFDRPKDWVDIETMLDNGTLDLDLVIDEIQDLLGDDDRVARLRRLRAR